MTAKNASLAAALLATLLGGCSAQRGAAPGQLAEQITRAVYADDLDATIANFDDATKKTVTRSELGELSDRMHALGDLKSLAPRSADPDSGKYEFDATFSNGSMLVQLRLDPSGKVGAYRVVPEKTAAPAAAGAAG